MKVKDIMTTDVQAVSVPGGREEALEILKKFQISAIPVLKRDTDELVGIVRLRDFFENPDEEQIGMLVDRDVPTISPDASIEEAAREMLESEERRLPVVKDGKLVGIITVRDIVNRAIAEREIKTPVLDFMQESVLLVWEGTPLLVAVEILSCAGARALPVVDSRAELSGMIGDADIIDVSEVKVEETSGPMKGQSEGDKWAWDSEDILYVTKHSLKPPDKTVKEIMSRDVVTVSRRTQATKCARLMRDNKINQIPVLSGKKLVGIVRDENLLGILSE